MTKSRQQHWDAIYKSRNEWTVSWFEAFPAVSLEMIEAIGLTHDTCIVDVGGGESRLIDALLSGRTRLSRGARRVTRMRSRMHAHGSAPPLTS